MSFEEICDILALDQRGIRIAYVPQARKDLIDLHAGIPLSQDKRGMPFDNISPVGRERSKAIRIVGMPPRARVW